MKLLIFGSCSGTEPMEGRHHTAFALEINGHIYWFDAGENCSYTAHLMGIDLLRVSDIFISHTHMDHVGGLGNLLWNIRKLVWVKKELPAYGDVTVHIPNTETFDGVMTVLKNTEGNYKNEYDTICRKITDGALLKNEDIEVFAKHNFHLPETEMGWQSFSFVIKAEGKKIIYSGDLGDFDDITDLLSEGCDLLLMETGHHSADEVCNKIKDCGYNVKEIYFLHHGREILYNYEDVLERCRKICPSVELCNDRDVFEI